MPAMIDPFDNGIEPDDGSCDLIMGKPEQQLTEEQIREVVNRHDPMGLLKMGAPQDEYDSEVEDILMRRNQCNMALTPDEIRVIFEYWFCPGCMRPEVAKAISSELQALFMGK